MILKGIHHITAITGDSPANVDFYVRVMGLRMVKKTVNFDVPDIYHLYYGDETGRPGSILTFFEYPGARRGRHGTGMIHSIGWGVAGEDSLDFWEKRLAGEGVATTRTPGTLRGADHEGLGIELVVDRASQPALAATWDEVPQAHALRGFTGVRVYGQQPFSVAGAVATDSDKVLTEVLGFERLASTEPLGGDPGERPDPAAQPRTDSAYRLTGGARRALYVYDDDPGPGLQGAGSVHHIAWACDPDLQEQWRQRVLQGHLSPTPIIDRQYFKSIYFREPSGVLFEIATIGPGFAIDEPVEALGEALQLPPQYEHRRDELQERLTPLSNPRQLQT
jgi:glyoxalase family protein